MNWYESSLDYINEMSDKDTEWLEERGLSVCTAQEIRLTKSVLEFVWKEYGELGKPTDLVPMQGGGFHLRWERDNHQKIFSLEIHRGDITGFFYKHTINSFEGETLEPALLSLLLYGTLGAWSYAEWIYEG